MLLDRVPAPGDATILVASLFCRNSLSIPTLFSITLLISRAGVKIDRLLYATQIVVSPGASELSLTDYTNVSCRTFFDCNHLYSSPLKLSFSLTLPLSPAKTPFLQSPITTTYAPTPDKQQTTPTPSTPTNHSNSTIQPPTQQPQCGHP